MQRGNGWTTWMGRAAVLAVLAAGLMGSVGCQQQQLEERNAALQKQLEAALASNSELGTENESLKNTNAALNAEIASLSRRTGTPATSPTPTTRGGRAIPNFGAGTEVTMSGDTMTIRMSESVLFASGHADLVAGSQKVLDLIAAHLKKEYPKARVRVEGHTDNQPIVKTKNLWFDNLDLSSNRAMTVTRYLETKGIDPKQVYAAGFGDSKPIASNDSPAGRAKNRRVEIVVMP